MCGGEDEAISKRVSVNVCVKLFVYEASDLLTLLYHCQVEGGGIRGKQPRQGGEGGVER